MGRGYGEGGTALLAQEDYTGWIHMYVHMYLHTYGQGRQGRQGRQTRRGQELSEFRDRRTWQAEKAMDDGSWMMDPHK